jgi:pimeloyl-ACP methyl ester carboxylesterase
MPLAADSAMLNFLRKGSGKPVLLVHGFLGGARHWPPVMDALSRRHDLIALDLPGFGASGPMPACRSIAEFAAKAVELMDHLGIRRFALLGHSMGGMIAQQLALDHAGRVEKLVLYGTAPSGKLPGRFETFAESIARIEREGIAGVAERIPATWLRTGSAHPAYPLLREIASGASAEAALAALRAVDKWDVRPRLAELRMPTLVLTGDRDRSTPPDEAFALWRGLPDARLCIAPNCAHAVHLDSPALFNAVLGEFLAG